MKKGGGGGVERVNVCDAKLMLSGKAEAGGVYAGSLAWFLHNCKATLQHTG